MNIMNAPGTRIVNRDEVIMSTEEIKEFFLPKLIEARNNKDWEKFLIFALSCREILPEAFKYYEEVPDELKYDMAINAYTHKGDKLPEVREAVINARKYGSPQLPDDIKSEPFITVYRAGEEDLNDCKYRISWTTSPEVAEFFYNTYINRHASHIYEATIKTTDIIAYSDRRGEREVMQYNSVYDVYELNLMDLEDLVFHMT